MIVKKKKCLEILTDLLVLSALEYGNVVLEYSLSDAYISDFMVGQILFIISIIGYRSVPGEMNILSPKIEALKWTPKAKRGSE